MRRLLLATSALALLGAGSAMASGSSQTQITATNPQNCQINSASPSIDLGTVVNVAVPGTFTYQCNFQGAPTLTFQSANGGVSTAQNGGGLANYGIYLNDAAPGSPPSTWLQASAATGAGAVYNGITTELTANAAVSPVFQVGLSQTLPVAGTYADTLTISIAP